MQYADVIVLTLLILLGSTCLASPSPQAGAGAPLKVGIFGQVVNAETHEVVRRAAIKVYTSGEERDELTDREGRFRFSGLEPGEYSLIVHRDGYTDYTYKVQQSDFDKQKELPIELHAQGVIAGRIVDVFGQALQAAQIKALRAGPRGGDLEVISSTETNELGEFRLSGLDPGVYRLRATYRDGRNSELDPTPLTMASAYLGGEEKPTEIAVKAGSLTSGVNFALNPVRPVTVRGTLRTETGAFTERATLWVMADAGGDGHSVHGEDGKFEITDLAPGTYTISVQTLNKSAPLFAIATVVVRDADVDAIDMVLRPVQKIDLEVRIEGVAPADSTLGPIYFTRTDRTTLMNMQIGQPDKDGRFTVPLAPGEYSLLFDESILNLGVQRATLDGKPVLNWRLQIGGTTGTKKLVIVLGGKPQP